MPTFDFSNIVNKIVSAALAVVANPVVLLTVFAGVLSASVGVYVSYFSDLTLPTLPSISLDVGEHMDSLWADLVGYIFAYDVLKDIVSFVVHFIAGLIPAVLTFVVSLFSAFWAWKAANAIRASLQDLGG